MDNFHKNALDTLKPRSDDKKNVTFINMNPPYKLPSSTVKLASENRTSSIVQILVCENDIMIRDLLGEEQQQEEEGEQQVEKPESISGENVWKTILEASHTVILPDSMFTENSRIFHTHLFLNQGGLEALVDFYQMGGTIIVMIVEGLFSVEKQLNERFQTQFNDPFLEVGSCLVCPTEWGIQGLLGQFTPKSVLLKENPFFIDCADHSQGLYRPVLQTKEGFLKSFREQDVHFEKMGIEKDETMDCFNEEKSWDKYLRRYTDKYCIAVHPGKGLHEGHVVWYGDRGQSDTMSYVFCKLLNLKPKKTTPRTTPPPKQSPWPGEEIQWKNVSLLFSLFVVFIAVVVQMSGLVFR